MIDNIDATRFFESIILMIGTTHAILERIALDLREKPAHLRESAAHRILNDDLRAALRASNDLKDAFMECNPALARSAYAVRLSQSLTALNAAYQAYINEVLDSP